MKKTVNAKTRKVLCYKLKVGGVNGIGKSRNQ